MTTVIGFPPVTNPSADTLILGSAPSVKSLENVQYYAHPRNAFWSIIAAIYGIDRSLAYDTRIDALKNTNIALWDVLQQCNRLGSLDSAIKVASAQPNDFVQFFKKHPKIKRVVFNGKAAEHAFKRHALRQLNMTRLNLVSAPSTSPAYTIPLADKIAAWRIALKG